jgi:tryptophan synthase alpha chain
VSDLEARLRALRETGRRALVPYLMGGMSEDWLDAVRAVVHAGADAVELGLPFSDPIMDGPVIQRAGAAALSRGASITTVLSELAGLGVEVPLVVMTYYNVLHRRGLTRAAGEMAAVGVSGVIVPDLPLEELGEWRAAADAAGLACVLMVAPSSPPERVARVAAASEGFLYAAARMAVTGAAENAGDARRVVEAVRAASDIPVYVGIGISTPALAGEAASFADGVIVGSALVSRLLEGAGPAGAEAFVGELRSATG